MWIPSLFIMNNNNYIFVLNKLTKIIAVFPNAPWRPKVALR